MQASFSPDFVMRCSVLPCAQLQAASTQLEEPAILVHPRIIRALIKDVKKTLLLMWYQTQVTFTRL